MKSTCAPLTAMRRIVLDTNCLLQALPSRSPYHKIWNNKFVDCAVAVDAEYIVTNDTHFNILKQIDWPRLTVIDTKEFTRQLEY